MLIVTVNDSMSRSVNHLIYHLDSRRYSLTTQLDMQRLPFFSNNTLCDATTVLNQYVLATSTVGCIFLLLCVLILQCKQRKKTLNKGQRIFVELFISINH
jgi:hypothetical protein